MKVNLSSLGIGFILAIGLSFSGMTQTHRVIGFLDISANWDPSLLFVMIGALGIQFFSYQIIKKRKSPLFASAWHLPDTKPITGALLVGSFMFGIGWGLAGYAPGPAIVSLASFQLQPLIFIFGMLGGIFLFRLVNSKIKFKL